jgi:hypothetical protein
MMNDSMHGGANPPGEPEGRRVVPGAEDCAAIDALMGAGFDGGAVDAAHGHRAARVAELLRLLECEHVRCDRSLVDVTLQRLARMDEREPVLCVEDADAMDSWALCGFDAARTPGGLRERAERHEALAEAVRESAVFATPLLVERTFAAIAARATADRFAGVPARTGRSWRLADVISIAAMVLIGVSVLWPTLDFAKNQQRQYACQSNLGSVASAMGLYAGNHRDSLPMVTAGLGTRWWDVAESRPQSNASNLYTLARTGYAKLHEMACPGNARAQREDVKPGTYDWSSIESISFSYQIMQGPARPNWQRGASEPSRVVVLADRSPVVRHAMNHEPIDPMENSPNHGGRGQFALRADGSVCWMSTPERPCGDNIWLPRPIEELLRQAARFEQTGHLEGFEIPCDAEDSFVGP